MNKKFISAICLFFLFTAASPAPPISPELEREGRSDLSPKQRVGYVMKRGALNVLSEFAFLEVGRTAEIEKREHPKSWLLRLPPFGFTNYAYRMFSGLFDLVVFPFVAPFTDDIRPLTETFDLPEYPWIKEEEL